MNETHFNVNRIKSNVFRRRDIRTAFNENCDPIYVAFDHLDSFSIKFLAKLFIKDLFNDSIKFISKAI